MNHRCKNTPYKSFLSASYENWWTQLYPEAQVLIHFLEFLETNISGMPIFLKSYKKKIKNKTKDLDVVGP